MTSLTADLGNLEAAFLTQGWWMLAAYAGVVIFAAGIFWAYVAPALRDQPSEWRSADDAKSSLTFEAMQQQTPNIPNVVPFSKANREASKPTGYAFKFHSTNDKGAA